MRKIDCIVSDLGKVLVFFDHFISAQKIAKFSRFSAQNCMDIVMNDNCVTEFGKGFISGNEFYHNVCKLLEVDEKVLRFEEFRLIWADIFMINRPMIRFLEENSDRKRILLSNTDEIHFEWIEKKWNISEYFDEVVLSYKSGYMKPEDQIFEQTLYLSETSPEKILYIDDIEEYTKAFSLKGVNVITYDPGSFSERIREFSI